MIKNERKCRNYGYMWGLPPLPSPTGEGSVMIIYMSRFCYD